MKTGIVAAGVLLAAWTGSCVASPEEDASTLRALFGNTASEEQVRTALDQLAPYAACLRTGEGATGPSLWSPRQRCAPLMKPAGAYLLSEGIDESSVEYILGQLDGFIVDRQRRADLRAQRGY